eukprot:794792-Prymnesium_polylepis.2
MQDTLDAFNGAEDVPAHLTLSAGSVQLMDALLIAGWTTLIISFVAIIGALVMDWILLFKQRQMSHLTQRATALGASFSPKIFRMDHNSWLLPDWIIQATDEEVKLVSAVESVVTAQSLAHK